MSGLRLFLPITKIDEEQRLVYGVLTQEICDKSGEIFDYATGKPAVQAWSDEIKEATKGKSLGNVRSMHDGIAAGKFTDIVYDDENKRIEGAAKIVDDAEWAKCREGVYSGFSIGGSYTKRWQDKDNPSLWRFTPKLSEISLVDNPCVPTATFEYIKADGSVEMRKFTPSHKEESMDPKELAEAKEALAKGTATDEQKALIANAEAETLLKAAQEADSKGEATEEQKALLAKLAADAKPELVKDGKPVKPKAAPVQKNVWLASDQTEHPSKREAEVYNLYLEKQAEHAPGLAQMDALLNAAKPVEGEPGDEAKKAAEAEALAKKEKEAADKVATQAAAAEPDAANLLKAAAAPVKKSLYQIGWMANLLSDLKCIQSDVEWEQMWAEDAASEITAKFKSLVAEMCSVLVALVDENTKELIADGTEVDVLAMAAKMDSGHAVALAKYVTDENLKTELEKAGARHSKTDKENLMALHKSATDHVETVEKCFKGMGIMADDQGDKDAKKMSKLIDELNSTRDEVSVMTKLASTSNEALVKAIPLIETLQKTNADLVTRMDHLERQPAAPKGHVRTISKAQDSGGTGDGDAAKAEHEARMAKLSPAEKSRALMKLAMANPQELPHL